MCWGWFPLGCRGLQYRCQGNGALIRLLPPPPILLNLTTFKLQPSAALLSIRIIRIGRLRPFNKRTDMGLNPCSNQTREVLGNPSLTPEKNLEGGGNGFPNTSQVFGVHLFSHLICHRAWIRKSFPVDDEKMQNFHGYYEYIHINKCQKQTN